MIVIGKPSINGPFSMAMLNNQRVHDLIKKNSDLVKDGGRMVIIWRWS